MAGQDITFDFLTRGADTTAAGFRKVGDNTILAAKGAKVLADVIDKLGQKEDRTAAESKILASALRQTGDAEDRVAARAVLADAAIRRLGDAMQDSSKSASGAAGGFGALAGAGGIPGGGMGAAIAAGVALSPVIATLGVGLGGLGLAAAGAIGPIEKAAGKTGGLAANMSKLNPEQQALAVSILGLGKQYHQFQKELQPEVLGVFNTGIKLAGGLLHDIQPVAQATGKAFEGFLGQVDAEFRSRTWQDFFGFMAAQAGPDMKLLASAILPLLDTLPKLLTDIQPIAVQLLQAAGGAAKLGDAAVTLNGKIQHLGSQAGQSGGLLGHLADAGKKAVGQLLPGIPAAQALGKWLGVLGGNSDTAGKNTARAGDAFKGTWPKAQSYAQWVQASATATKNLANAQSAAVSTQLAYGNDILTSANDAQTFHDKLKASAGQIGLHTQAERDSFGAANTYIGDLARQATTAVTSGHGTDAAITAIRNGLPVLQSAKTRNREYWQEVSTLVGYLHKLELIKFISTPIHVTGTGKWSVTGTSITPGVAHGPQNIGAAPGGFAFGGLIAQGRPGVDDQLILAQRGEVVVPTHMVRAGAVDHLRGKLPGFAAGGVAGSYGPGAVGGLPRWTSGRIDATLTAIAQNTAQATLNAMAAAQAAAKAAQANPFAGITGVPSTGAFSASAAVAQAYAKSILWAYGWGQNQFPPLQALWNGESGWRWNALNAASGAYGIPQSLPASKMASAGADWRTNYQTQIRWGLGYIKNTPGYGSPAVTYAKWLARSPHWYSEGGLVPGFASGGLVPRQGAAWLKAWRSRHGGGFGAAWGPVPVNEQIAAMAAAAGRASTLAKAGGLTPGQHRFWAAAAADEKKRLGVLTRERDTEREWRSLLGAGDAVLAHQIAAAGRIPGLAGPVRGWKSQMARQKATIAGISAMLGYSDAQQAAIAKAHPPPAPTGVQAVHTYGGDVADNLGTVLAAALGPFTGAARGGLVMDSGGWLKPGFNPVWNKTGRPEQLVPARRGGRLQIEWVGGDGGDDLVKWIKKNVKIRGGTGPGAVDRAFGSR